MVTTPPRSTLKEACRIVREPPDDPSCANADATNSYIPSSGMTTRSVVSVCEPSSTVNPPSLIRTVSQRMNCLAVPLYVSFATSESSHSNATTLALPLPPPPPPEPVMVTAPCAWSIARPVPVTAMEVTPACTWRLRETVSSVPPALSVSPTSSGAALERRPMMVSAPTVWLHWRPWLHARLATPACTCLAPMRSVPLPALFAVPTATGVPPTDPCW